ncbi:MAG: TonB-dependent receptor, partial [Flavobacteriaceae bacterium]|nr:TonB-dependent receptor [Flavobacteriaceae bacterium]
MKKIFHFFIFLFVSIYWINAQSIPIIKGKVVDNRTNNGLQNVNIVILNSTIKTVSKPNGTFEIQGLLKGEIIVQFYLSGSEFIQIPVIIGEDNINIDLGIIRLTEKREEEIDRSFIHLNDGDLLVNDKGESNSISGLLVASKDVFLKTVAYEFSPTFFRPRNLGLEYSQVLLNGVTMNKQYNGRPQWGNWGGLNDVLRNQEFTSNFLPSPSTFGDIAGTTNMITQGSNYRKGTKISYAASNRSYKGRVMASYSSGLLQNGWAYTFSASRRFANEGFREGTIYDANSFFIAVEKVINEKHSLNFTAIYASNRRGKSSPNTQEVYDLKDTKYNAYWGKQEDEIRNSRIRDIVEPILQLNHFWNMNTTTTLQTNVTYQFGKVGNSRLDYGGTRIVVSNDGSQSILCGGSNPDPTYYQKLPSYFLRDADNPDYENAYLAEQEFLNNGQINWRDLYAANQNLISGGNSIYALYEDRNDDKQLTLNTIFHKKINDNFILNSAISYRKLKSENFANMLDLLGGTGFLDVDVYADNIKEAQSDLQNPNRIVTKNDRFKYN